MHTNMPYPGGMNMPGSGMPGTNLPGTLPGTTLPGMSYTELENKLMHLEHKIKKIEKRISKLESGAHHQHGSNDEHHPFSSSLHMM